MAEPLEDCGAEIVHYTSRVKRSELPKGPLPREIVGPLERINARRRAMGLPPAENLPGEASEEGLGYG